MQLPSVIAHRLNSPRSLKNLLLSLFLLSLVASASSQSTTPVNASTTNVTSPMPGVSVVAYNVNDQQQFTLKSTDFSNLNVNNYSLIPSVAYYLIGISNTVLEVRTPFGGADKAPIMGGLLTTMNDFVYQNRNGSNIDAVSIKLYANNHTIPSDICETSLSTPSSPCPDMIILGTTQIAGLAANNIIISLEDYFSQYSPSNSLLLKDSFSKFTYYDYIFDGSWVAVPLQADIRLLFYNQTTFQNLGLTAPPPTGNWGIEWWNNWTWPTFVQYATTIRNSGLGYGFTFSGNFDEETKLISMIARNWKVQVVESAGICGLNSSNFYEVLDQVVRPLFMPNNKGITVANSKNFYEATTPGFQQWANTPLESVDQTTLDPHIFCCQYADAPVPIVGMTIDAPQNNQYSALWALEASNISVNPAAYVGDLGVGFVPGIATYLGGMGVAITQASNLKSLAWSLIEHMTSTPYLDDINIPNGLFPPYDTALTLEPWKTSAYDVARQAFKHAVPIQYPSYAFSKISNIEYQHVFRQMMLEIILKNATNEQAVERTCQFLDDVLALPCTHQDWNFTQPLFCTPGTNNLDLVYSWNDPHVCRNGSVLPAPYSINCPYVAVGSPFGVLITVLSGFGCFMSILYIIMLAKYRHSQPVKMGSFIFSEVIVFGSLLMFATPFFMMGVFTTRNCSASVSTLVIGFGMAFGGLLVKLLRIHRIMSNKGLRILRVTDRFLFRNISIILTLEAVTLIAWNLVDGGPKIVSTYLATEPTLKIDLLQSTCNYGAPSALAVIGVLNIILVILAVGMGFATWSIPTQFNETKMIIASVFGIAFGYVVCIPLLYFVQSASLVMIVSLAIDFVLAVSMAIFCIPKLYYAILLENVRSPSSIRMKLLAWVSKSSYSVPKGIATIEVTNSKKISSRTKGSRSRDILSQVSETSEDSAIPMEPTASASTVRRSASNSHNSTRVTSPDSRQFNLESSSNSYSASCKYCGLSIGESFERSSRVSQLFCPHCGIGVDRHEAQ